MDELRGAIDDLNKAAKRVENYLKPRPIWPHYLGFTLVLVGVFAGCAAYTKAQASESAAAIKQISAATKAELTAQRLAFTDVMMRWKEDPKDQARFDKTMEELIDYYRKKLNESN